jgi:hypothetical protein
VLLTYGEIDFSSSDFWHGPFVCTKFLFLFLTDVGSRPSILSIHWAGVGACFSSHYLPWPPFLATTVAGPSSSRMSNKLRCLQLTHMGKSFMVSMQYIRQRRQPKTSSGRAHPAILGLLSDVTHELGDNEGLLSLPVLPHELGDDDPLLSLPPLPFTSILRRAVPGAAASHVECRPSHCCCCRHGRCCRFCSWFTTRCTRRLTLGWSFRRWMRAKITVCFLKKSTKLRRNV